MTHVRRRSTYGEGARGACGRAAFPRAGGALAARPKHNCKFSGTSGFTTDTVSVNAASAVLVAQSCGMPPVVRESTRQQSGAEGANFVEDSSDEEYVEETETLRGTRHVKCNCGGHV